MHGNNMRNGRPLGPSSKEKLSKKKVIEAIEEKEGTFSDILKRVDVSKKTLSVNLQELEREGRIERYYEKGKVIIRLSDTEANPVETALRHLDHLTNRSLLDFERGRAILTEDFSEEIIDVATFIRFKGEILSYREWLERKRERGEDVSQLPNSEELELNEFSIIRAYARILCELIFFDFLVIYSEERAEENTAKKIENMEFQIENVLEIPKELIESSPSFLEAFFPALSRVADNWEKVAEFHNWIEPLFWGGRFRFPDPDSFPEVSFSEMSQLSLPALHTKASNIPSQLLNEMMVNYERRILRPLFREKGKGEEFHPSEEELSKIKEVIDQLSRSRKGREEEKEGGEKEG